MKPYASSLLVMAILASPAMPQGKPDFSGNWKIDVKKSDFGPLPSAPSYTRKVEHSDPRLTLTEEHGIGDESYTRTYTTDGKPLRFPSNGADVIGKVVWEGDALVFTFLFNAAGFDIQYKYTWRLSEDKQTLTNTLEGQTPQGPLKVIFVFDRQ
jgi:hypothetical protein